MLFTGRLISYYLQLKSHGTLLGLEILRKAPLKCSSLDTNPFLQFCCVLLVIFQVPTLDHIFLRALNGLDELLTQFLVVLE